MCNTLCFWLRPIQRIAWQPCSRRTHKKNPALLPTGSSCRRRSLYFIYMYRRRLDYYSTHDSLFVRAERERKGMNEDTSPVLDGGISPESRKDDDVSYTSKASPSDSHHSSSSSSPQNITRKNASLMCADREVMSRANIVYISSLR